MKLFYPILKLSILLTCLSCIDIENKRYLAKNNSVDQVSKTMSRLKSCGGDFPSLEEVENHFKLKKEF